METAILKQARQLSDYAIDSSGNVVELDTQEQVREQHNASQHRNDFKLLTDEKVWLESKKKHIRLWRRFTREELVKLYNRPDSIVVELGNIPQASKENVQVEKNNDVQVQNVQVSNVQVVENVQVAQGKNAQVVINGTKFNSIKSASLALDIDRRTIKKRLDDDSNRDYIYI